LRRPGTASTFTPSDGTVHEWITSAAVTRTRISICIGSTIRLSTSRSRYSPGCRSVVGTIYESISISEKSVYSYLQYHWCPIAFSVSDGFLTSSVRYKSRSDGSARKTRIIAGTIVQIVSICCASIR